MSLKVFNTMSKRKEDFIPISNKEVTMFVCGQTVYDDAHLGHAKNYVNFDAIVRFLRHSGFKVKYIQNITDIDDKIINRAKERNIDPMELSRQYTERFFDDMKNLRVKDSVDDYPKSTDYMKQIIEQIESLISKGYAYEVGGDVYFDVSKFKDYTKLSRMKLEELEKHRIEPDERKKNAYDFSLWKKAKEDEISWDSPWGKGRPGWHIEDTAITTTIFGPQYDLHGGANELIFPHHTNEIAQAEAATGKKPFVKYWMHSGVLKISGEKMSKSLKNFVTIRQALEKHGPEILRMWILSTHYRKPIDYNETDIDNAASKVDKIKETLIRMKDYSGNGKGDLVEKIEKLHNEFHESMEDDFNTPLAISKILEAAAAVNQHMDSGSASVSDVKKAGDRIIEMGEIMQIIPTIENAEIPKEAQKMLDERDAARKKNDFQKSDELRERLKKEFGIIVEDTPKGQRWKTN